MHIKSAYTAALLQAASVLAFPKVAELASNLEGRGTPPTEMGPFPFYPGRPTHALFNSFDPAEQHVSTTGAHKFIKPRPNDIRGPCAGLNAAANHGYLPRDGIATRTTVLTGLQEAYGLATDLLVFLQTATMFFDGDPITGYWSIGPYTPKTYPMGLPTKALGNETGICNYGHLKTEGDASITRGDFLAPTKNSNCYSYPLFMQQLLDLAKKRTGGRLTPQVLAEHQYIRKKHSIATNPNYFSPPYAGVAFTFGAHMFAWELLANHSAAEPRGFLEPDVFMSFFSYHYDKSGKLISVPGEERIPDNWYRRSQNDQWDLADVGFSTAQNCVAYPTSCQIGGNTGKVNSFMGVNPGDISGGFIQSFNDLQDPQTYMCFLQQNLQAEVPAFANKLFSGAAYNTVAGLISQQLPGALAPLGACPGLPPGKSILQYDSATYPGIASVIKGPPS